MLQQQNDTRADEMRRGKEGKEAGNDRGGEREEEEQRKTMPGATSGTHPSLR